MKKTMIWSTILIASALTLSAQDASQSDPYQGVSNPPPDNQITTEPVHQSKPSAGKPAAQAASDQQTQETTAPDAAASDRQPAQEAPASDASASAPSPTTAAEGANAGNDDGIVQVAPEPAKAAEPALDKRSAAPDPDGDIVHPAEPGPGELGEGTTIRVKLLDRLSTAVTEKGQTFRTKVAYDVVRGGEVLIPAGAEIDGKVVESSSGHMGTSGTLRLKPETLILADGTRYQLRAVTSNTRGSKTNVGSEGEIKPDSRVKRDSIEYGGAVGAGVTTGAVVAGPAGALAGGLIGAGVVTAHLLISHPQAVLEPDTVLEFTLSETLSLSRADYNQN
jgi:hypothetical protein